MLVFPSSGIRTVFVCCFWNMVSVGCFFPGALSPLAQGRRTPVALRPCKEDLEGEDLILRLLLLLILSLSFMLLLFSQVRFECLSMFWSEYFSLISCSHWRHRRFNQPSSYPSEEINAGGPQGFAEWDHGLCSNGGIFRRQRMVSYCGWLFLLFGGLIRRIGEYVEGAVEARPCFLLLYIWFCTCYPASCVEQCWTVEHLRRFDVVFHRPDC